MSYEVADEQTTESGDSTYRATIIWYVLGVAAVFVLMAFGVTSENHTYYNASDTSHWWSPVKLIFAAIFALVIPLPHALIALAFKSKRNLASVLRIFRGWYKFLLGFVLLGTLATVVTS